jgi:hypothetical protein
VQVTAPYLLLTVTCRLTQTGRNITCGYNRAKTWPAAAPVAYVGRPWDVVMWERQQIVCFRRSNQLGTSLASLQNVTFIADSTVSVRRSKLTRQNCYGIAASSLEVGNVLRT